MSDEHAEAAWRFWAEEHDAIERFLRSICRRHAIGQDGYEAMYSECASKLPAIVRTWRPEKRASLKSHVFANLKWYIHKLLANGSGGRWGMAHSAPSTAKARRHAPLEAAASCAQVYDGGVELRDRVAVMRAGLTARQRGLLRLVVDCELPLKRVARLLGVGAARVTREYAEALAQCRARDAGTGLSAQASAWLYEIRRSL